VVCVYELVFFSDRFVQYIFNIIIIIVGRRRLFWIRAKILKMRIQQMAVHDLILSVSKTETILYDLFFPGNTRRNIIITGLMN